MNKSFYFMLSTLLLTALSVMAERTVTFRIVYDKIDTERGELYQYSERYLGAGDVITESGTTYVLRSVRLADNDSATSKRPAHRATDRPRHEVAHRVAMSEEALMATSTARKAESIAKQIYRIREARLSILSGEAEHTPTDGAAMKLVLNGLNKQEEELTALFVGTRCTTPMVQTVTYTINEELTESQTALLLRFSRFAGPVAADDLSGEPVYIDQENRLAERPSTQKKHARGEMETYIADSRLRIRYNGKQLLNLPVAQ